MIFVDTDRFTEEVFAKALGRRNVGLPTDGFHRNPESLIIQPTSNFGIVVGNLEVIRPTTNDGRSTDKTDRDALLHRAVPDGIAQALLDFGDGLLANPDLGL